MDGGAGVGEQRADGGGGTVPVVEFCLVIVRFPAPDGIRPDGAVQPFERLYILHAQYVIGFAEQKGAVFQSGIGGDGILSGGGEGFSYL